MATTLPSHASLLTSAYPARHGILSNFRFFRVPVTTAGGLRTGAQMLRQAGYATAAFTSSTPLSEASGIGAGFDVLEGPPPYEAHDRRIDLPAGETVGRALEWLAGASRPFFLWVHLFDPHTPYRPPPPFDSAFADEPALFELLAARRIKPRKKASAAINRYDGEIRYADAEIGRLLDELKRRRLYDAAVIVLAGDHGEGLWQHGVREHGVIWNEQLKVPLILRLPGVDPGRRPQLASLIDVLPTLAANTALPLDAAGFDGIDLLSEAREWTLAQREIRKGIWAAENFALVGERFKYLYFADRDDLLFDLEKDPGETYNAIARHPEVARTMRRELGKLVKVSKERSALQGLDDIPEEVRKQLEALGYVE